MTNAIEQTRREMYESFIGVKAYSGCKALVDLFETRLEAHLEALRNGQCVLIAERDTLRNRIQAFEMASQTSAEVIKGLREELKGFRYSFKCVSGTSAQDSTENAASAKTDPYTLGYSSVGKCSNPFPINTVERLHWNDGARDRMSELGQRS